MNGAFGLSGPNPASFCLTRAEEICGSVPLREKEKVYLCVRVRESREGVTGEVPVARERKMTDHVVESTFELSAFMKGEF